MDDAENNKRMANMDNTKCKKSVTKFEKKIPLLQITSERKYAFERKQESNIINLEIENAIYSHTQNVM